MVDPELVVMRCASEDSLPSDSLDKRADGALSVRADESSKHDLLLKPCLCSSVVGNVHLEEPDLLKGIGRSRDEKRADGALYVRADESSSKHDLCLEHLA